MRRSINNAKIEELQKAVDSMAKRLREQETVIEAKDAMLEVLTVENGKLKERIKELEPKNPWAEVEE